MLIDPSTGSVVWHETHGRAHLVPAAVGFPQGHATWWQPKSQESTPNVQLGVETVALEEPAAAQSPAAHSLLAVICGGRNFRWKRAVAEVAPAVALFIATLVADANIKPYERPVSEYDHGPNISHPLQPETVDTPILIFLSWGVPSITILLFALARRDPLLLFSAGLGLFEDFTLTHVVTTFGKKVAGSLRPNFLALCEWDGVKCNANFDEASSARQSFPSGHASNAAGGLVFMALLIAKQLPMLLPPWAPKTPVRMLAVCPVLMALWIAITRTRDYFHRFEDIVAGLAIGTAVAGLIFQSHFRRSGEHTFLCLIPSN